MPVNRRIASGVNAGPATERVRELFSDFDTWLDGEGALGVAVSGGGDSVALLYALTLWGKRPLEVLCVDHGLNPASEVWTRGVGDLARRLGAGFTALKWHGDKPATGISAAARMARHALLAQAARDKGMRVLCLAHTYDDRMEAEAMREAGSNVGDPKAWAPSPIWPEGRGVWLCRPFMAVRRAELRAFLLEHQADWIEDPANSNPQSLRARVRSELDEAIGKPTLLPADTPLISPEQFASVCVVDAWTHLGQITFQTAPFLPLDRPTGLKLLAGATVCAGGGSRLPRAEKLENLYNNLAAGQSHTLCGARVTCSADHIVFSREAGEFRRHAIARQIVPDEETIWDGRFGLNGMAGADIRPVTGLKSRLSKVDQAVLTRIPAQLRPGLPVRMTEDGPHLILPAEFKSLNPTTLAVLANPSLRQNPYSNEGVYCWVWPRFVSALGLIRRESEATDREFMLAHSLL